MSRKKRKGRLKKAVEDPDWSGVDLQSVGVGGKTWFTFDGYKYCTPGEMILAKLLKERLVPFTADVRFEMKDDNPEARRSKVIYAPDFIFDRTAWLWTEEDGTSFVIHGLEVKAHKPEGGSRMSGLPSDAAKRMYKKQALLYKRRRIVVIIVSEAEVEAWERDGNLPISAIDADS